MGTQPSDSQAAYLRQNSISLMWLSPWIHPSRVSPQRQQYSLCLGLYRQPGAQSGWALYSLCSGNSHSSSRTRISHFFIVTLKPIALRGGCICEVTACVSAFYQLKLLGSNVAGQRHVLLCSCLSALQYPTEVRGKTLQRKLGSAVSENFALHRGEMCTLMGQAF